MKVGKFLVAFVFSLIFMAGNCFAGIIIKKYDIDFKDIEREWDTNVITMQYDSQLLEDLKNNPQNYIENGIYPDHIPETFWIFKPSLEVQQYAPPKYIISINRVMYINEPYTAAYRIGNYKFLYDYNEQKIYLEKMDSNHQPYWEYLEPKFVSRNIPLSKHLEAAELAFYFAYKQSFFKKPLYKSLKNYIKNGKLKTFADYKN